MTPRITLLSAGDIRHSTASYRVIRGVFFLLVLAVSGCQPAWAAPRTGMASYYTRASAMREGNSGVMANGRRMNDEAFTAASWDFELGTRLEVCRAGVQRVAGQQRPCVEVVVTDRGPAHRLYRQGRIIDLSQKSFSALADLKEGVIDVTVEVLSQP